jgi:hypothetical protein
MINERITTASDRMAAICYYHEKPARDADLADHA